MTALSQTLPHAHKSHIHVTCFYIPSQQQQLSKEKAEPRWLEGKGLLVVPALTWCSPGGFEHHI